MRADLALLDKLQLQSIHRLVQLYRLLVGDVRQADLLGLPVFDGVCLGEILLQVHGGALGIGHVQVASFGQIVEEFGRGRLLRPFGTFVWLALRVVGLHDVFDSARDDVLQAVQLLFDLFLFLLVSYLCLFHFLLLFLAFLLYFLLYPLF